MNHFLLHLTRTTIVLAVLLGGSLQALAQSASLPTDRGRIRVASVPDPLGGPMLKVLRTDQDTPLRAGTAWIWSKNWMEEPPEYYAAMRGKGLNSVRIILFDTWEFDAGYLQTDWTDPQYRAAMLGRIERAVNYASRNGLYAIINSHNKIPSFNAAYDRELWSHVAPYFAGRTHVAFEAWNEPLEGTMINGTGEYSGDVAKLQAMRDSFGHIRNLAPNTHIMVLTPAGVSGWGFVDGLARLTKRFSDLPGPAIDWTKTSVAYHLYHADESLFPLAQNLRDFHSKYPGWPSENSFPAFVTSSQLGIPEGDNWRSVSFGTDVFVNQTCERLGLGWSHWHINRTDKLNSNFPILWQDAVAKNYNWQPDHVVNKESRFNAGGGTVKGFSADINFFGGQTASNNPAGEIDVTGVEEAASIDLYRTERWGDFSYQAGGLVPNHRYHVRLHFCETWSGITGAGQRLFDVLINGTTVLGSFDVYHQAGGRRDKAVTRTVIERSDSNGRLTIEFRSLVQNALVNGIEIIPSDDFVRSGPPGRPGAGPSVGTGTAKTKPSAAPKGS